jgi:peroxiredoxin
LEQIKDESSVIENKQIAENILNSFSKLKSGALAPSFELPDKTGLTHSLDELRSKKFIYILFFDQQCTTCLQQMKMILSLKKQYGTHIEFVGISIDKTNAEFKNFCLRNPEYNWLFLFDNSGTQLKNNYEIKSLPAYFLIDMEGKFVQAPAESPDGNIVRTFYDITKPKSKKHNVGDKSNR